MFEKRCEVLAMRTELQVVRIVKVVVVVGRAARVSVTRIGESSL